MNILINGESVSNIKEEIDTNVETLKKFIKSIKLFAFYIIEKERNTRSLYYWPERLFRIKYNHSQWIRHRYSWYYEEMDILKKYFPEIRFRMGNMYLYNKLLEKALSLKTKLSFLEEKFTDIQKDSPPTLYIIEDSDLSVCMDMEHAVEDEVFSHWMNITSSVNRFEDFDDVLPHIEIMADHYKSSKKV